MTVAELQPGHVELLGDEAGEVLAAGGHVVVGVHGAARTVVGAPHVRRGEQLLHGEGAPLQAGPGEQVQGDQEAADVGAPAPGPHPHLLLVTHHLLLLPRLLAELSVERVEAFAGV